MKQTMKQTTIKILMIGNHKSIRGGITSVVNQFLAQDWSENSIQMKYIPSYIGGSSITKIVYFMLAYIRVLLSIVVSKPDLIHAHMSYKGSFHRKFYLYKLAEFFHIRYVVHLHGSQFKDFYYNSSKKQQAKIRQLLSGCYKMIVLGEEWNKTIQSIEPKTDTIIIQNSIKIPKDTVEWNEEVFSILFLGVLIERKGVADLLDAINILNKENRLNNAKRKIRFVIAGSGQLEDALKQKSKDLGIDKWTEFTGWVTADQKPDYLLSSQLMVLPSYNEGLPIALLEAISYGLPIISTKVGSIDEAVEHGKNGYLIEAGDVRKLSEELLKFIETDRSDWAEYSRFSRDYAIEKFSEDQYFESIINLYKG